jgi:hypothetical protein
MQFCPPSRHFVPLWSKCPPQHLVPRLVSETRFPTHLQRVSYWIYNAEEPQIVAFTCWNAVEGCNFHRSSHAPNKFKPRDRKYAGANSASSIAGVSTGSCYICSVIPERWSWFAAFRAEESRQLMSIGGLCSPTAVSWNTLADWSSS